MTLAVLIVFFSKLPMYIYVAYRAYHFRHKLIMVSANWLGGLAFFATLGSLSVALTGKDVAGFIDYGVVASLFMLAYTARELKTKE